MKTLLTIIFTLFAGMILAQTRVTITLNDDCTRHHPALVNKKLDVTLSDFFTSLNSACAENKKPNFEGVKIIPGAIDMVMQLWDSISPFTYNLDYVSFEHCVIFDKNEGVFHVRLPIDFVKREKYVKKRDQKNFDNAAIKIDFKHAEIKVKFDSQGQIIGVRRLDPEVSMFSSCDSSQNEDVKHKTEIVINKLSEFSGAYFYKDISVLNKLFKQDAVVIVGKECKVKQKCLDTPQHLLPFISNRTALKTIRLTQYTAQQYLRNLNNVFRANKDIYIRFDDVRICKVFNTDNLYYVQLMQTWRSSNGYHDIGYLTLIWDFNEGDNPIVASRIWMPKKTKNVESSNSTIYCD